MPQHITIPAAIADLGFSIDVPDGFIHAELPPAEVDFDNPTQSAPIGVFSSQVALALIAVAGRPAYETGSVLQWFKYLCDHFGIEIKTFTAGTTSGANAHPAILAEGAQEQDGQHFRMVLVAFEDGTRLVTAHAMCPVELWPSYGAQLTAAVQSISLTNPKGPTVDLDSMTAEGWTKITPDKHARNMDKYKKEQARLREPAEQAAAALVAEDRFEEAEAAMQRVDSSIYGSVALARIYEARLKTLVEQGAGRKQKERVEAIFHRALSWAQNCYPEPHTEDEGESYEAGRKSDRARLVSILGYEPR